jgi:hypothetical protein
MELYKIIATIKNTAPDTVFELAWIPENFEGVKINQSFSFVAPIGFNPKFSVDTMRTLNADKWAIDDVFDEFGLESNVTFLIKKLNVNGFTYDDLATFAIDFTSYEKFDFYSEFALKSVSVIDYYNDKKNTEFQLLLSGDSVNIPNTLKYINYVSLKSKSNYETDRTYFKFEANNTSKIYNSDASLYHPTSADLDDVIYYLGAGTVTDRLYLKISSRINLKFTGSNKTGVSINLYKVSGSTLTLIHTFITGNIVSAGTSFSVDLNTTEIDCGVCSANDFFIVATNMITSATITGDVFIDVKRKTSVKLLNSDVNPFGMKRVGQILNQIFDNRIDFDTDSMYEIALTSGNELTRAKSFATIKPTDFMSELCKVAGLIFNFKNDGRAEILSISEYFNTLFDSANAIEVTDFKDLSIKYSYDLTASSVLVGQEIKQYEVYPYSLNWQKKLVFSQSGRNGDDFDLSMNKYRLDFSGIIDSYLKRSEQSDANNSDIFLFKPDLSRGANNEDELIYDGFTPRDVLVNNSRLLSFMFQNYGKSLLTNTSNGGTTDDLMMSTISQMDDLELDETPRLLPIEYNLTCLIDDVDFSENILKINHEGEDVYLFVINAETTDNLSEQEIRALKIQLT